MVRKKKEGPRRKRHEYKIEGKQKKNKEIARNDKSSINKE